MMGCALELRAKKKPFLLSGFLATVMRKVTKISSFPSAAQPVSPLPGWQSSPKKRVDFGQSEYTSLRCAGLLNCSTLISRAQLPESHTIRVDQHGPTFQPGLFPRILCWEPCTLTLGRSLGCPVNSGYSVDNLQGEGLGAKLTLLSLLENREEAGASEPLARNLSMPSSSLTLQHSGHPRTRGEASAWGP